MMHSPLLILSIASIVIFHPAARAQTVEDAMHALKSGRSSEADGILVSLARRGDLRAMTLLGGFRSVEKDHAAAVGWYRQAAEKGYAAAQYKMGLAYANGRGVVRDGRETVRWNRLAVNQGFEPAVTYVLKADADYPSEARTRGIEGSVALRFRVTPELKPEEIVAHSQFAFDIDDGTRESLERSAIEALQMSRFLKPDSSASTTIPFWTQLRSTADVGVSEPLVTAIDIPANPFAGDPPFAHSVIISFTVDPAGDPKNYKLVRPSPNRAVNFKLINSTSLWRFEPAMRSGGRSYPVAVRGSVEYVLEATGVVSAVFRTNELSSLVTRAETEYSVEGEDRNVRGSVALTYTLNDQGQPRDIHVTRSLGEKFDKQAIAEVRSSIYQPAFRDGVPVESHQSGVRRFNIPPIGVYKLGPGISKPKILVRKQPPHSSIPPDSPVGSVEISIVINAEGLPEDLRVMVPLNPELDQLALEAVSQWRFEPARKDGVPVKVLATVSVEFSRL